MRSCTPLPRTCQLTTLTKSPLSHYVSAGVIAAFHLCGINMSSSVDVQLVWCSTLKLKLALLMLESRTAQSVQRLGCELDDQRSGFDSCQCQEVLLFSEVSTLALGPTLTAIEWVTLSKVAWVWISPLACI